MRIVELNWGKEFVKRSLLILSLLLFITCNKEENNINDDDNLPNPFLEDWSNRGKEDTAYYNPDGIEVEVDFEADIEAPSYRIFEAPPYLGQYALTYLRKKGIMYLESLAEDATSPERVEWLVDGNWINSNEARSVDKSKLTHFRIRGMNAVLLHRAREGVQIGTVFDVIVPINPYTVMSEAGKNCADEDSHIGLSQSVYWYLWNPSKRECNLRTQKAKVTISRMFQSDPVPYPEYDKLIEDGLITSVIIFGQIGDDPLTDSDPGMYAFRRMEGWLKEAGFREASEEAPVGKRYEKTISGIKIQMDLYSPYDFSGLSDYAHYNNFERAIKEHEIVVYDGHSMLGASDFWARPQYPSFYQIFIYGGCLGYEYYIRPIYQGKGGWENLDIVSSVVEVSANATRFAGPFFAKLFWALEHNFEASWKDILGAIRSWVGDSTFGASGVRDNCFTPRGSRCEQNQNNEGDFITYSNNISQDIPDNNPQGITSEIEIQDDLVAESVYINIDITHTWIGDLLITIEHSGTIVTLWNKEGGNGQSIKQSFEVKEFARTNISGKWTLKVVDTAARDIGTLNSWSIIIKKQNQ